MKELKRLLLTFDYELFLGRNSGTVDNCIIKPTNHILKILNRHNINAVFFVDTVYLLKLKEKAILFPDALHDYEKIINQLKKLIQDGHYLFPHIHAHWCNAEYNSASNTWQLLDLSNYRFHDLKDSVKDQIFDDSIRLLKDIILPLKPGYMIDSYRAGGWCIQPFSDFKSYFTKHDIRNDFSVVPGINSVSQMNYHDFTNAKKDIYHFENDILKDEGNTFCEYPVSTLYPGSFEKFIYKIESKLLWKLNMKNSGDGNAAQFSSKPHTKYGYQVLSADAILFSKMPRYKKYIKDNNYIQFVSHPKMLSSYNIKLFGNLLAYVCKKYSITSDYKKMKPNYVAKNSNTHRHKAEFH